MEIARQKRLGYYMKPRRASPYPDQCCSFFIDWAEHSLFGLFHFVNNMKDELGHAFKIVLVHILDHRCISVLINFFTIAEERGNGFIHVVKASCRVVKEDTSTAALHTKLCYRLDIFTCEKKSPFCICEMLRGVIRIFR